MSEAVGGFPLRISGSTDPELLQAQMMAYARDLRVALDRSRDATSELARTHLETVAALAAAVDVRDEVTGGHVYRVANYGALLAEEMAPELRDDPQLVYGFLLHDIGKLAVPDAVLCKAGPLTADEQDVMRSHVEHGIRFVKGVSFLRPALNIIATHHEHYDGTGYPQGLVASEIPLASRMFIVCDAFDAMIHDRPYRDALAPDHALSLLRDAAGAQFDPDVVEAVEARLDDWLEVDDRPAMPPLGDRSSPARQQREAVLASQQVFDSLDQPMVMLSPDGVVRDANRPFLELFRLLDVPVGMLLHELIDRSDAPIADLAGARDQWRQLERDLFDGRREGRFAGEPVDLHWFSNVIRGDGDAVVGRVLVISRARATAPSAGTATRTEAATGLRRAAPAVAEARDLLTDADPHDPAWRRRADRVRAGLDRLASLAARLEDDAVAAAGDGAPPAVPHPEAGRSG